MQVKSEPSSFKDTMNKNEMQVKNAWVNSGIGKRLYTLCPRTTIYELASYN